ncbi:MAG: hypothetical protein ACTFAL_16500 [Candidatus Electronema sp. V4]|uniref:hypothetical protein n=1 Tax=Candidatus Electronema sp. V4 TaxID=3454756 RepID=UPI00405585A3
MPKKPYSAQAAFVNRRPQAVRCRPRLPNAARPQRFSVYLAAIIKEKLCIAASLWQCRSFSQFDEYENYSLLIGQKLKIFAFFPGMTN